MDNHFRNRGLSLYSEFNLLNLRVTGPNASYAPTHIEMIEGEGEDVTKLGHFKQKGVIDLREASPGNVEITYKVDVTIVGKLAMFGDRVMRSKAKQVEEEFTKALEEKLKKIV
jgi:carbon monoxide dehydrogenase subunit G